MRRSLSVGLLLVALSALPAVARGSAHGHFGSHAHFVRHFHHFNHFIAFRFNRFGNSRFFGSGDWADGDVGTGYGGASGSVIVLVAPPPPTAASAAAASPAAAPAPQADPPQATTVSEAGVMVVRGPGSHHLR
jgi:hypothetical protein